MTEKNQKEKMIKEVKKYLPYSLFFSTDDKKAISKNLINLEEGELKEFLSFLVEEYQERREIELAFEDSVAEEMSLYRMRMKRRFWEHHNKGEEKDLLLDLGVINLIFSHLTQIAILRERGKLNEELVSFLSRDWIKMEEELKQKESPAWQKFCEAVPEEASRLAAIRNLLNYYISTYQAQSESENSDQAVSLKKILNDPMENLVLYAPDPFAEPELISDIIQELVDLMFKNPISPPLKSDLRQILTQLRSHSWEVETLMIEMLDWYNNYEVTNEQAKNEPVSDSNSEEEESLENEYMLLEGEVKQIGKGGIPPE